MVLTYPLFHELCYGSCGYFIQIADQNGQVLASQAGLIDAEDQYNPPLPERTLDSPTQLVAQTQYTISIMVWSTKSVGINTTGQRTNGVV
jgi:hypothetical protein